MHLGRSRNDLIAPAFTHSQAAQPVRVAHIWNFHAMNFMNDAKKIGEYRHDIMQIMPLGAAAVSGTHLSVDLKKSRRA